MKLRTRMSIVATAEHDGQVLARVAAGDIAALGVVYDRHYGDVLNFARRITRRSDDAEDVTQETFIIAARSATTFDGRSGCRPWLYGIASRIVMQRNRAGARLARFLGNFGSVTRESPASPERLNEQRQLNGTLTEALDHLTPAKRVVVVMAEAEGMSCEEIASLLEIPVGTVWTRLHHARRELRARLSRGES